MPALPAPSPHDRPDLRLPMPLRKLRLVAFGSVGLGLALSAIGLLVLWSIGGARAGVLNTAVVAPFVAASGVGVRIVSRRRRALMDRIRAIDWRACTACAYPLEEDATRCPECGIEITANQAIAAWVRTP